MRTKKTLPSQDLLLSVLTYEKETGFLYWKIAPTTSIAAGTRAGVHKPWRKGSVMFRGETFYTAPIIWKMVYNEEPPEVDHADRDNSNDRLDNLRAASHGQNMANRGVQKNNKSGVTGVRERDGKFQSYIRIRKRMIVLGTFLSKDEAISVRRKAEEQYQGEFQCAS